MAAELYMARRSFGYGDRKLDRGEVLQLQGQRNDTKLVRLGYVTKWDGKKTIDCGICQRRFVDEATRSAHGQFTHDDLPRDARDEDQRDERRERYEQTVAPLYLDKTAASRGVSP